MLDPNLTGIVIISILALIPITIVSIIKFTNMKLKTEQIRAETAIKTEEIRAKNKLDIEKLIMQDSSQMTGNHTKKNFAISGDNEGVEKRINTDTKNRA